MSCYLNLCVFLVFAYCFLVQATPEDLTYYFKSKHHHAGVPLKNHDVHDNIEHVESVFDRTKKTVVLIHGWKDNHNSNFNNEISEAIFNSSDANVIVVDWSVQAGKTYIRAKNSVPNVGNYCATFLSQLLDILDYPLEYITVVGFSLGAHVSGIVGKHFEGSLPLIIGLDPARPLIQLNTTSALHSEDAKYVQIIHTDAGSAGVQVSLGDSDFYPNGGNNQLGCSINGCDHNRAWVYFAESIRNNQFLAQQCHNFEEYSSHNCYGHHALMGGLDVDVSIKGTYYLITNEHSPFGRG
ncbi:pancreatic triacylglycerol lipase-like [Rhynchophorus ferrugineus]|uniref:pancreatic triacylglycerol lipase-like n=1 Tax=Rhynchophorus ferrugineus TaxID=354439 RepID=UPI003FCCC72A